MEDQVIELQSLFSSGGGIAGGIGALIVFFLTLSFLKSLLKVAPPNKLLVVTGRKTRYGDKEVGFSVERGSTFVIPYLQTVDYLGLDVLPINVRVEGVNSANGITLGADATACVCIDDDNQGMLFSAVERTMGKDLAQVRDQVQQTLVGNFRGALNKATPLEAIGMQDNLNEHGENLPVEAGTGDRALFRQSLLADIDSDISSFGMRVVSVSLQKIWDTSNYIANLAQKTIADKRQEVEVEEARLKAEAERAESDARRRIELSKNEADEKIVEATERLEVYRKESESAINQVLLEAQSNISEAQSRGLKEVEMLKNELKILQNRADILLKEEMRQHAAEILAAGEESATQITEQAKNSILRQKAEMLTQAGEVGEIVLFIKQQLPQLYAVYKQHAEQMHVDTYIEMSNERGFDTVVNRGPEAFVQFLKHFEEATGINIKHFLTIQNPAQA
ncbi:MAG: SPFH domain-containing protein [Bernardetiaceae bacterium]